MNDDNMYNMIKTIQSADGIEVNHYAGNYVAYTFPDAEVAFVLHGDKEEKFIVKFDDLRKATIYNSAIYVDSFDGLNHLKTRISIRLYTKRQMSLAGLDLN